MSNVLRMYNNYKQGLFTSNIPLNNILGTVIDLVVLWASKLSTVIHLK